MQADAWDMGVGAVLLQENENGQLQPCAYTSKKTFRNRTTMGGVEERGLCCEMGAAHMETFLSKYGRITKI